MPSKVNVTSYSTSIDLFMKALDLKDTYKLFPVDYKTIIPELAEAMDSVPSAFISKDFAVSGAFANFVSDQLSNCITKKDGRFCPSFSYVDGITGKLNSPQGKNVSISEDFRTALAHIKYNYMMPEDQQRLYEITNSSYFSESSFTLKNYAKRYWGSKTQSMVDVKVKYDPNEVFACYHCIDKDSMLSLASPLFSSTVIAFVIAITLIIM